MATRGSGKEGGSGKEERFWEDVGRKPTSPLPPTVVGVPTHTVQCTHHIVCIYTHVYKLYTLYYKIVVKLSIVRLHKQLSSYSVVEGGYFR